jgi:hypothetical protein
MQTNAAPEMPEISSSGIVDATLIFLGVRQMHETS